MRWKFYLNSKCLVGLQPAEQEDTPKRKKVPLLIFPLLSDERVTDPALHA